MLAIGVELLSGRYVATAYNDRDRAEWPPHPARLFSALVAAWADGDPSSTEGLAERDALRWLEQLAAPIILASGSVDVAVRTVVPVFVPVNDVGVISIPDVERLRAAEENVAAQTDAKTQGKAEKELARLRTKLALETEKATAVPSRPSGADLVAASQLFPERRLRQPRTFPSVAPSAPAVAFLWPDADAIDTHRMALARVLGRVPRLGHSSSVVHARMIDATSIEKIEATTTSFIPDNVHGTLVLRWVNAGQCDRLVDAFERHREVEPRILPAVFVRYCEGKPAEGTAPTHTIFGDDWLVFARVRGPNLPMTATAAIARQFRRALMSFADQPIAEIISGHREDGSASEVAHLAVMPLPFVASKYADGSLLGVALIIPRAASAEGRAAIQRAVAAFEASGTDSAGDAPVVQLHLGQAGSWSLQRVVWGERKNMQPSTWSGPSRRWASATPVALDQNPGDLHHADPDRRKAAFEAATLCIAAALDRIGGLPKPTTIDVLRSCVLAGTAKPRAFPRFPAESSRPQRVLVHVRVVFPTPVRGPILLGAGRYQGLGLLRPLENDDEGGA